MVRPSASVARACIALLAALAIAAGVPMASGLLAAPGGPASEALASANRHWQAGDFRAARIEMMNAIKAEPDSVLLRIRQAEILLRLFDSVGAEAELRRAVDLGASPDLIRVAMAEAILLQGDPLRAREWLDEGQVPADQRAYAARMQGRVALALDEIDAARQAFDRALALGGDTSLLWTDIARFRFVNGDQAGAVEAVEHAVELDQDNIRALQFRGELMRTQYGLAAALPWFERALQIDPTDVPVLEEYGATLGDMGRMREMLDVARRIIALQPRNSRAFMMQAVLAARAGEFDLARHLIQKTGDVLDRVPAAMQLEGVVEFQLGNYQRAIDRFDRLVQRQPHNQQARNLLARALYAEGEHRQLIDRFLGTAEMPGADSYLLTLVARSLEAVGDRSRALPLLERASQPELAALTTLPENGNPGVLAADAQRQAGDARSVIPYVRYLVSGGQFDMALPFAQRLATDNPGVPDAHLLVGDVQLAAGRASLAVDSYARAADIAFSGPVVRRLVTALRQAGRLDDAEAVLVRYVAYSPADADAARMLAATYIDHGNWGPAAALLSELRARLGDNQPMLLSDLALAETRLGRAQDAARIAGVAYAVQPASRVTSHMRGYALSATDSNRVAAVQLLEKARTIGPSSPWLDFHLGQAYAAAGAKNRAISALRLALAQGPFPDREAAARLLKDLNAG